MTENGFRLRDVPGNAYLVDTLEKSRDTMKIFIVEDEPMYARMLEHHLSGNPDHEIELYSSGKDCLDNLYKKPDVVTVDYHLPDMHGSELLKKILRFDPGIAVIMISGQRDITVAIDLLKQGAYDYIVKDEGTRDHLWNSLRLLAELVRLRSENERLSEEVGTKFAISDTLVGDSPGMHKAFALVEKAASSLINVAITGETGTGKELIAKAIHYHSPRKKRPFIAMNVGAIPKDLVESELFGFEKGAFTGAINRKSGVFEEAHTGTLFLDEIGEMDLNIQTRFLRVLQEKEVKRLGSNSVVKVDVRIITATHKNLAEEVKKGLFRPDLFYRLMGLPIHLPPLRERGNDIMVLARYFAGEYCRENSRAPVSFTPSATAKLLHYHYPGNVRELKAVVELAIIMSDSDLITEEQISFNPVGGSDLLFGEETTLDTYIARIIGHYLEKYGNNATLVAEKLGIGRATVYRYINKYHLK